MTEQKPKLIFLDIDGVLNSVSSVYEMEINKIEYSIRDESGWGSRELSNLKWLLSKTKANVVIHSTWRKHFTLDVLQRMFDSRGILGERIIGVTRHSLSFDSRRDKQLSITIYLEEKFGDSYEALCDYVVIDDHKMVGPKHDIDIDSHHGLQLRDLYKIETILNEDYGFPIVLY